MSLHISFVQPSVTDAYMVDAFEDTFGATVTVELSKVLKNKYGANYKMATIRILEPSRDLSRFIDQIRQHGNNSFYHRGCESWNVKLIEKANITTVKARIV
jgi:hypothetical protein